jgi:TolB-like protein
MSGVSNAVFLSYASQDAEAAERIAQTLRAAGIEVWLDQTELRGGEAWDRQIRKQIHDCALFVPVISAHSDARREGYFRREWKLAVDRTADMAEDVAFLLPVIIDTTPDATARVPDRFRDVQWSRLPGGETSPAFIERVQRLLSIEPSRGTTTTRPPTNAVPGTVQAVREPVRTSWWLKSALLAVAAVLSVALAYLVVDRFWPSKRMAPSGTSMTASAGSQSPPVIEKSIAVLPFVDLTEKQDQAYLADGMAEEVIDLLARLPGLKVIGRTSSFQFRGKALDARTIGATLGVAHLLEGSIRRSGNTVRVTAQLLSTQDGTHEWSETYETTFDDVLKAQAAIAASLARALETAVGDVQIPAARTVSPAAYDLFLKGMHALDPYTREGCEEAIGFFTQSLKLDPNFAPAFAGTAWSYDHMLENAWLPTAVASERARANAQRALEIDSKMSAAHAVLADVHMIYDWDWAAAEQEIEKAFVLGGRDAAALEVAGRFAAARDPTSEKALTLLHEAIALDPLNANVHTIFGWIYLRSGRFTEAESPLRRALQISPKFGSAHWFLAIDLLMLGRTDEALEVASHETVEDGQFEASAAIYHAQHRKRESDKALAEAISHNAADWASATARVYAFRGESTKALEWLDRAYAQHDEDLYFIKGDPLMRNLEGDPRYKAFLEKMKLAE